MITKAMIFEELSDEAKLCFVIFTTEQTEGFHHSLKTFYDCGPPMGSFIQARDEVVSFLSHNHQAKQKRAKERRKISSRMRV